MNLICNLLIYTPAFTSVKFAPLGCSWRFGTQFDERESAADVTTQKCCGEMNQQKRARSTYWRVGHCLGKQGGRRVYHTKRARAINKKSHRLVL